MSAESINPRRGRKKGTPNRVVDPATKHILTVVDVQNFLGKSKRSFYKLRNDAEGVPCALRHQGRDHWTMSDISDWIASKRRKDSVPGRRALAAAA